MESCILKIRVSLDEHEILRLVSAVESGLDEADRTFDVSVESLVDGILEVGLEGFSRFCFLKYVKFFLCTYKKMKLITYCNFVVTVKNAYQAVQLY